MVQNPENFVDGGGGPALPEGFVDGGQQLPETGVEEMIRRLLGQPEDGD